MAKGKLVEKGGAIIGGYRDPNHWSKSTRVVPSLYTQTIYESLTEKILKIKFFFRGQPGMILPKEFINPILKSITKTTAKVSKEIPIAMNLHASKGSSLATTTQEGQNILLHFSFNQKSLEINIHLASQYSTNVLL